MGSSWARQQHPSYGAHEAGSEYPCSKAISEDVFFAVEQSLSLPVANKQDSANASSKAESSVQHRTSSGHPSPFGGHTALPSRRTVYLPSPSPWLEPIS
jgi:hypothetical protein